VSDDARRVALNNEVLRVVVGSTVCGTRIDGVSDHDELGVCVPPETHCYGLDTFEQWVNKTAGAGGRSGPDDTDLTIYSAGKYVRLAFEGNPSVLATLWTPDEFILKQTAAGRQLLGHRSLFVSRKAGWKFLGYLGSQREKALGQIGNRTNRPELVEQYGRDVKFEYHMVRLAHQGVELLTTGSVRMPMGDAIRNDLLAIRRGEVTQQESLDVVDSLVAELRTLLRCTYIPAEPDRAGISALLVDLHEAWWAERNAP
jgi:predicted nucleotidyltransferase